MGELWYEVGKSPDLAGLDHRAMADVLLRAGALTGSIGSAKQIEGAQEIAKNLISEGARQFESLGLRSKTAEAQIDLAVCYWREGAFSEARVILHDALEKLTEKDNELKAIALLRSAIVEESSGRYHDALGIYVIAAPLFESIDNSALRGKFHHVFGFVYKKLSEAESRQDYVDRGLMVRQPACSLSRPDFAMKGVLKQPRLSVLQHWQIPRGARTSRPGANAVHET